MPSTYVCVLHSGNGFYTDTLVGNALQCLHAVQRSVRATAPDFIPSIAVFLADPQNGARCVFSSVVPDRNHALDRVAATYPPLADANGALFAFDDDSTGGCGEDGKVREKTTAFAQLFRLRSPLLLQQSVLRAVRVQNAKAPTSAGVAHEGFVNMTASASPSTISAENDSEDAWGPLAGALLASLCYLRAHPSSAMAEAGADDTETNASDAPDGLVEGGAHAARSAGRIFVFSDACAMAAPSYSAECALAMGVVTASKMGVVVSCFGDAVVQRDATENRLVGLASSLGGFCAARFTLADLGQLLDGESAATDGGDTAGSRARQKRDRITSQYVVGPTMLPRTALTPSALEKTSLDVPMKSAKVEEADGSGDRAAAAHEQASHLGWLCPSCMAIIYRSPRELPEATGTSNSRGEDGGEEQGLEVKCPYCHAA